MKPTVQPSTPHPTIKTTAVISSPSIMEKATISLGIIAPAATVPNRISPIFSPPIPPINIPGSSPTRTNRTSPIPVPMYNPFFAISFFDILLSSLLCCIELFALDCIFHCCCLTLSDNINCMADKPANQCTAHNKYHPGQHYSNYH